MSQDSDLNAPELRARAVRAARGEAPFDLLIRGGQLLDMVTGQMRRADVGICGGLIASVHAPDPSRAAQEVLDADELTLLPGFIDTHMHIESSLVMPEEYARAVVPRGVTTALWDPHEFANATGRAGMAYALDAARQATLRLMVLAPSCVPSAPGYEAANADFDPATIAELLSDPQIHGVAEVMTMQPLLKGDARSRGIVNAGLASGKRVCGHARGLGPRDLNAYAAAGVQTDHELTSGADLMARLEAGMTVEMRGSHAHLLPEFAQRLLALGHLPQTLTLCTDDVFPDDLLADGGLDQVIRLLIRAGLPAWWAYGAATLNAATQIGRRDLGLVAPGRRADIALIGDLNEVQVHTVVADGRIIASAGALLTQSPCHPVPQVLFETVVSRRFAPKDFEIAAIGPRARIDTLSKPRFPEWGERIVEVESGVLKPADDMIRMSVINRYTRGAPVRTAFLENWGVWQGAYASTLSHDSHNLTIFGRDAEDMAVAANAVVAMGGGMAVVRDGQVLARLALPLAGLVSPLPLAQVARGFAEIRAAADQIAKWEPPFLVFKALFGASLICNPGPRLSDMGLVDPFAGILRESPLIEDGI
ncbi:hypothetical protein P775_05055 [Puniceibacterium antarcticum]|uniref:Adenine deaminase n=1 Tax=Puniceibacterium antarcticum TaxID=1206336 RepID=A0A2G8RIY4_9RHOB|nr:adenine deaminase C-terminal domain-containing protein [Puniceibacterium antarcticum]PIL21361.1 hypothetical protein P775_05055 [Puniceibacterium antarcticum]